MHAKTLLKKVCERKEFAPKMTKNSSLLEYILFQEEDKQLSWQCIDSPYNAARNGMVNRIDLDQTALELLEILMCWSKNISVAILVYGEVYWLKSVVG